MADFEQGEVACSQRRADRITFLDANLEDLAAPALRNLDTTSQIDWSINVLKTAFVIVTTLLCAVPAVANNVGENGAWQFETTADMANRVFIEDMRQKKKSGYYAAPIYTTNIDKQYNCAVSSLAAGNQSTSSSVANSPSTTGNSASSIGNTDSTSLYPGTNGSSDSIFGSQSNDGSVGSAVTGNVEANVRGDAFQTLNTTQTNSGNQTADVTSSNACQFGVLN